MHAVKEFFTSRHPFGKLVEYDFSQLEIRVLAELSGCENLKTQLFHGLDMHAISTAFLYGCEYISVVEALKIDPALWTKRRRLAKAVSFQFNYGASDKSISESTKVSLEDVRRYRKNYNLSYPEIERFIKNNTQEIIDSKFKDGRVENMLEMYSGKLKLISGRELIFRQQVSKWSGGGQFSKQQIMNYPIQGTAADIVDIAFADVAEYVIRHGGMHLVDTIHDSILLDIPSKTMGELVEKDPILDIMNNTWKKVKDLYGYDWKTPLPVDRKVGDTWANMETV